MRPSSSIGGRPLGRAELDALVSRRAAQAERATDAEVDRIVGLANPMDRMAAHAALVRLLGEEGATLPSAASARILLTLHQDAEARELAERRRRYAAERAAAARLERLRPWALGLGLPIAAVLPVGVAAGVAGWGVLDVLVAVLELPWLIGWPLAFCAAAAVAFGAFAWLVAEAAAVDDVLWWLGAAAACGVAFLAGARLLPVHMATDAARFADGSGICGSLVRVERVGPGPAERIHVLRGADRASRGQTIPMPEGQALRWLRGG